MSLLNTNLCYSQKDSVFKPEGKIIVQVINRTMFENNGDNNKFGMYINRSHFGYSYNFSPKWSAAIVLDAGRPTVFGNLKISDSSGNNLNNEYNYQQGSYYSITLKFSYLEFNPTRSIKLQAGGILQNHYITQEKFWGYRYISETFADKYLTIPSGDLGIIGYFTLNDMLAIDLAITNGEGFRNNQDSEGNIKYAFGIDFKPIKNLFTRIYYDNTNTANLVNTSTQELYSAFVGYKIPDLFRIGASYDYHNNHKFQNNRDLFGFSIFSSLTVANQTELFARFDNLRSNKLENYVQTWNNLNDGNAIMVGLHHSPIQGISFSLSYQNWNYMINNLENKHILAFSFEYKL